MTTDSRHQEIDELLPWYANGTLEGDERLRVERHLAVCEPCRNEMALLRDLGATAAALVQATPPVPDTLGQVHARIDAWERSRQPPLAARIRARFQGLFTVSRMPRLVLLGQSALIVALAVALVLSRAQGPELTTLSGGERGAGPRLTVIFEPAASEESIRQVLQTVDGTIVAGPSAAGVYTVAIGSAAAESPAVDAAITSLREHPSVIRFVEREP